MDLVVNIMVNRGFLQRRYTEQRVKVLRGIDAVRFILPLVKNKLKSVVEYALFDVDVNLGDLAVFVETASRLSTGDNPEAGMIINLKNPRPHFRVNHYVKPKYLEGIPSKNLISVRIRHLFDHIHKYRKDPGCGMLDTHFELVDFLYGLFLLELLKK